MFEICLGTIRCWDCLLSHILNMMICFPLLLPRDRYTVLLGHPLEGVGRLFCRWLTRCAFPLSVLLTTYFQYSLLYCILLIQFDMFSPLWVLQQKLQDGTFFIYETWWINTVIFIFSSNNTLYIPVSIPFYKLFSMWYDPHPFLFSELSSCSFCYHFGRSD